MSMHLLSKYSTGENQWDRIVDGGVVFALVPDAILQP